MYVWFYLYLLKCASLGLLHELQLEWTKYRFQDMIVLTSLIVTTILIYLTWFYLVKVKPRKGEPPGKTTRVILNRWTTYKSLVCLDIRYLGWLFAIFTKLQKFCAKLNLDKLHFFHFNTSSYIFTKISFFFRFWGTERERVPFSWTGTRNGTRSRNQQWNETFFRSSFLFTHVFKKKIKCSYITTWSWKKSKFFAKDSVFT